VQRPRPVALGEAAIVRAIADSRAGRNRALGIAQLNATFTKTQGAMLSFRAFTDDSLKMLMLIVRYRSGFKS
jgi:hypothetical protein